MGSSSLPVKHYQFFFFDGILHDHYMLSTTHDAGFPGHAIDYCLREAGLTADQLDYVGFYVKFERLLEPYLAYASAGFKSFLRAMPLWLNQKLHLPREIAKGLHGRYRKKYVFTQHHVAHAASAFYPSPYDEAAILTMDGVGEWATCSFGVGRGNRIELSGKLHFPHSLGLLYSAFTDFIGFNVNGDEYKLVGLAPYGEPRYADLILDNLLDLKPDGSFRLDMAYFNYCQGLAMTTRKFDGLFGRPPRRGGQPITRSDMDIAASIQQASEEIMLRQARHVQAQTGMKQLCLAGGTAELVRRGDRLICAETGHAFAVTDNIPQLFWPHVQYGDPRDRTEIVKYSGVRNSISVGDRNSWRGAGYARSWPKTSGGSSVWRQGCSAVYRAEGPSAEGRRACPANGARVRSQPYLRRVAGAKLRIRSAVLLATGRLFQATPLTPRAAIGQRNSLSEAGSAQFRWDIARSLHIEHYPKF